MRLITCNVLDLVRTQLLRNQSISKMQQSSSLYETLPKVKICKWQWSQKKTTFHFSDGVLFFEQNQIQPLNRPANYDQEKQQSLRVCFRHEPSFRSSERLTKKLCLFPIYCSVLKYFPAQYRFFSLNELNIRTCLWRIERKESRRNGLISYPRRWR